MGMVLQPPLQAKVKTVLFDLDDTLFDHTHSTRIGLNAVRQRYDRFGRKSIDELERDYLQILDETWPLVLQGRITAEEARLVRLRHLFTLYGAVWDEVEGQAIVACYREHYQSSRRPVEGVVPLLERLKTMAQIGIVTNNLVAEQRDKLRYCRIDHLIDFLVTPEQANATKPAPAIFEAALAQAGCGPQEAVMVGDSWHADVAGASAAGIRAIWLNRRGAPCPDPSLATEIREIRAFEPLEDVLAVVLGRAVHPAPFSPRQMK
jgi:putative hydrolase of the HAD superfamily